MGFKLLPAAVACAIGLVIWFPIPVPEGVAPNAWHLLALFVATIAAIIGKAMPIGALSILAIALVALTGVTNAKPAEAINDALSSFANPLIWLIGAAIMISRALIKTGLGGRIGYGFVALFGKRTLGIGYALALSELTIAPVTPSNTARGGGIMHPIMRSIADGFGSDPKVGHVGEDRQVPGAGELRRATVDELWRAGHDDVQQVVKQPQACHVTELGNGVRVFDL